MSLNIKPIGDRVVVEAAPIGLMFNDIKILNLSETG